MRPGSSRVIEVVTCLVIFVMSRIEIDRYRYFLPVEEESTLTFLNHLQRFLIDSSEICFLLFFVKGFQADSQDRYLIFHVVHLIHLFPLLIPGSYQEICSHPCTKKDGWDLKIN